MTPQEKQIISELIEYAREMASELNHWGVDSPTITDAEALIND